MNHFDAEDAANVGPDEVATYLRAAGWRVADESERASVWVRETERGEVDVCLPATMRFRDYSRRIAELVTTLSTVEQRSSGMVLRDLKSGGLDVQHIRTMPDGPSGTTPLHQGFLAMQGVHDLYLAAATSANPEQREVILPSAKPRDVWDFAKNIRFGQTAPGSYVLRVETPLMSAQESGSLDSRNVLGHLHSAVQSAYTAASQSLDCGSRAFEDHVSGGVSANLCEALSDIGDRGSCEFEMGFDWARAQPFEEPTPALHFDTGMVGALKRGGQHLRSVSASEEAVVEGRVVELRRHKLSGPGSVLVDALVTTDRTSFRDEVLVPLPGEEYERAVREHRTNNRIKVRGTARLFKRQKEMSEVRHVEWVQP